MKLKKMIATTIVISVVLMLGMPAYATASDSEAGTSNKAFMSGFYGEASGYRVLDKNNLDVSEHFRSSTISYFTANKLNMIHQFIKDNEYILEKHWFSEASAITTRASEVTRKFYVTRVEVCDNTAYVNAPDIELSYTISLSFSYDPNTFKVSSYTEPAFQLVNKNWESGMSNFQRIDTVRSSKLRANGIDVETNYYFKVKFDYRDDVMTGLDYKNVDFGTHGLTFVFNGDMDDHHSYE